MKPETVLGIAVEDPNAAAKVRRVVCASVFIMLLNIVCYAVPFALTKFPLSMLALLGFGLGVPACGYFGARNRSKPLLGCFWCMNCCNLVTLIILLCISGVFLAMFRPLLEELPAYADCCDQFRNCDWNASAVGCSSCIVNNADAPVTYMQERCDADGIEPAASSTFQSFVATSRGTEDYSDMEFDASGSGSSADEQKSLCLGRRECQIIVYIRHWRVTGTVVGVFLTLFILLMLPTFLGVWFGCSLFNHAYMTNITPYASVPPGSVADTQAVSASSYSGGYEPTEPLLKPA